MKIFIDGVEVVDDVQFFDGFNWGNFWEGDKVYIEDFDNRRVDGRVYIWFEVATSSAVWLATRDDSDAETPVDDYDWQEDTDDRGWLSYAEHCRQQREGWA